MAKKKAAKKAAKKTKRTKSAASKPAKRSAKKASSKKASSKKMAKKRIPSLPFSEAKFTRVLAAAAEQGKRPKTKSTCPKGLKKVRIKATIGDKSMSRVICTTQKDIDSKVGALQAKREAVLKTPCKKDVKPEACKSIVKERAKKLVLEGLRRRRPRRIRRAR